MTATATKERPIIFSAPMIHAILAGKKSQTRRIVKPQPRGTDYFEFLGGTLYVIENDGDASVRTAIPCPFGAPGDRLWVRETFCDNGGGEYEYRATSLSVAGSWSPSIHMPRKACRIVLEVVSVRVERVQGISEEDAIAEGCDRKRADQTWWQGYDARHRDRDGNECHFMIPADEPPPYMTEPKRMRVSDIVYNPRGWFWSLWDSINGAGSWEKDPWVWVVEFKVVEAGSQRSIS